MPTQMPTTTTRCSICARPFSLLSGDVLGCAVHGIRAGTMTTHTPGLGPWRLVGGTRVQDGEGRFVARIQIGSNGPQRAATNAAFIVRACNAHEEFVALTERLLAYANLPLNDLGARDRERALICGAARAVLRAAKE